jgi:CHASE2 domain-containing sensor protein
MTPSTLCWEDGMNLTSWLDLAGILLVVVGAALAVALWFLPAGVALAGLGLLSASWLIDRRKGGT